MPRRNSSSPSAPDPPGRAAEPVGRISAQVDQLVLEHMGAGLGQWGMFEAEDEAAAHALLGAAEAWLRGKGMTRAMGPFSLGIWDEPGLLDRGPRSSADGDDGA